MTSYLSYWAGLPILHHRILEPNLARRLKPKKHFTVYQICLQAKKQNSKFNANLSDVCIGTTAAPTYLPAYKFDIGADGPSNCFNLIDGGVAANNPVIFVYIIFMHQIYPPLQSS